VRGKRLDGVTRSTAYYAGAQPLETTLQEMDRIQNQKRKINSIAAWQSSLLANDDED
jgi:hypothetical protein